MVTLGESAVGLKELVTAVRSWLARGASVLADLLRSAAVAAAAAADFPTERIFASERSIQLLTPSGWPPDGVAAIFELYPAPPRGS